MITGYQRFQSRPRSHTNTTQTTTSFCSRLQRVHSVSGCYPRLSHITGGRVKSGLPSRSCGSPRPVNHEIGTLQGFNSGFPNGPLYSHLPEGLLNRQSSNSVPTPLVCLFMAVDGKGALRLKESPGRDDLRTTKGKDRRSKKGTRQVVQDLEKEVGR